MYVKQFLHKKLASVMHQKRLHTLSLLVNTVLQTKRLSVTELGRGLALPIQERSGIRRADRFVSNPRLQEEKMAICERLAKEWVSEKSQPTLLVDWTGVPNTTHHVLRAALVTQGRALTLYEEVHPQSHLENPRVHQAFLRTLKRLLPTRCQPMVITDGGFHNDWFREVLACGWNYVGRIRVGSGKKFRRTGETVWNTCEQLSSTATVTPRYVGEVTLGKTRPLATRLYLFKGLPKGRESLRRCGQKRRGGNEGDYRKMAQEPWLLATSLTGRSFLAAKRVVKSYHQRMQIEEGIRDLKSSRYGLSLDQAHSQKTARIAVLLLIAQLAVLLAWLTGWVGEQRHVQYQFQANSTTHRRVLSLFYLGCQMIRRNWPLTLAELDTAIKKGLGGGY